MAVVIETGAGVRTANVYAPIAFVSTYLTTLGRETAWDAISTALKEAAVREATKYIDTRWGARFKGSKRTTFDGADAQGILTYTALPSAADTVTVGSFTYTYVASLTTLGSNEIVIGGSVAATVTSTINAINGSTGTDVSASIQSNDSAEAVVSTDSSSEILLSAIIPGLSGNDITLSISSAGNSVGTAFTNGLDSGSQPLEFPRVYLYDPNGKLVIGVPLQLKQAMSEYADRARVALLYTDPTVDPTGKVVTGSREKVGPIETETTYTDDGSLSQLLTPYPAADRLLNDYLFPGGSAVR